MSARLLQAERLSKSFGALRVTDEVTLALDEGQLVALIGPNGAGKTTLLNLLCGALAPDAGCIRFLGRDVTGLDLVGRARLGFARSFQIASAFDEYSVLTNVALAVQARFGSSFRFFGRVAREGALNAPAQEALEEVGLGDRAAVRAGALSHGEKRLLEIAIALAQRPRLMLLDEPFAGLGPEETRASVALLARLKRDYAILLVEHDMDAVFALADEIGVLVGGRLLAWGAPDQIRADESVRAAYLGEEAIVPC